CCVVVFFFFQAEDGIRDRTVTGVQTCALPISAIELRTQERLVVEGEAALTRTFRLAPSARPPRGGEPAPRIRSTLLVDGQPVVRSEERRVGKEGRCRWAAEHQKTI